MSKEYKYNFFFVLMLEMYLEFSLITLINMFLEFGSSPAVNATEGASVEDNEYSVFGPTVAMANIQVRISVI